MNKTEKTLIEEEFWELENQTWNNYNKEAVLFLLFKRSNNNNN